MTFEDSERRSLWRTIPAGLELTGSLTISFQRYLVEDAPHLPSIPKSLGALDPFELEHGTFLVPVHDGEGVWLGIEFTKEDDTIRLLVGDPPEWHEFVFGSSASHSLEMIAALPGPRGALRFGSSTGQCPTIDLAVSPQDTGCARVEFVDRATFERLTGRPAPAPARREDGYGDWRLP